MIQRNKVLEKLINELIKYVNSKINIIEYLYQKCDKNWRLIDLSTGSSFFNCTEEMIKCVVGLNMCRDRIQLIDNNDRTNDCHLFADNE